MKLTEFLTEIGRPLAYYPSLAKIMGVKECIFLCQLVYWDGKQADPDGWIYKKVTEINDETGLSYKEQVTARRTLRRLNLLAEKEDRLNHKKYYRVNLDNLNDLWNVSSGAANGGKGSTRIPEQPKGKLPNCPKGSSGNSERSGREVTDGQFDINETEITTETTTTKPVAVNNKKQVTPENGNNSTAKILARMNRYPEKAKYAESRQVVNLLSRFIKSHGEFYVETALDYTLANSNSSFYAYLKESLEKDYAEPLRSGRLAKKKILDQRCQEVKAREANHKVADEKLLLEVNRLYNQYLELPERQKKLLHKEIWDCDVPQGPIMAQKARIGYHLIKKSQGEKL
jgi:hypothetical protein